MYPNPENQPIKDFYKLLGVNKQASLQDIKKAFKRQAMRWHPDKNDTNEAKQMFTNIRYAYEVLAKDQSRKQYDESGVADDEGFDIAGVLQSYGKRLSDEYKNFIKEKITFFQNHQFINNCDIEQKINAKLNKKNFIWKPNKNQVKRYKKISEKIREIIFAHDSFIEWPKLFFQINSSDQNQLRALYKQLLPDKKLLESYKKLYVIKIYLLQALILFAEQAPIKCLNKLEDAALLYPSKEIQLLITTIISEISFRKSIKGSLNLQNIMIDLKMPQKLFFGESLKMNKILNLIKKYDIQISKMSVLEGAYTYIDLCRALSSTVSIFGCLTMSCIKFLQYVKKAEDKQKYAYCKLINNLAKQILTISMKYFTPSLHLYALKIVLTILINSNRELSMVNTNYKHNKAYLTENLADKNDIQAMEITAESIQRMYSICPFSASIIYRPFDMIYVDVILRGIVTKFLENMEIEDDQLIPHHMASYYLFEGTWQGWYSSQFQFRRFDCMVKFLEDKKWNEQKVSQILKWPLIKRQNGWISEATQLQLSGRKFTRFDGFSFDFETGKIQLLMTQSNNEDPFTSLGLFTNKDVQEIFAEGISDSFFTLEDPDGILLNHPFQQFRYGPSSISKTSYLQTLLHVDYLLKMLTTGIEINAEPPFIFRDINEGLTKRLPKQLKQKITLPDSNVLGQAHRFWIQAGQVPFTQFQQKQNIQKLTVMYGQLKMKVKTHLLKRNLNGQLVDADDDDDEEVTAEKTFAKNFTENYYEIGLYYPILLRLKQLVKISAAYNHIKGIYQSMKQNLQKKQNCQKRIKEYLCIIKSNITFPINTDNARNERFQQILKLNAVVQSQVAGHQITRVKNEIYSSLDKAEIDLINAIKDSLTINFQAIISNEEIRAWLSSGTGQLQNKVITALYKKNLNKLALFQTNLSTLKINLKKDQEKKSNYFNFYNFGNDCLWIPAAFKQDTRSRRVYGGVILPLSYKQIKQFGKQTLKGLKNISSKVADKIISAADSSIQVFNMANLAGRVAVGQCIRKITSPVKKIINYYTGNHNKPTNSTGTNNNSYITVYRSKFPASQKIGAELYHSSVHITVNGKSEIWQYGRYNGTDGTLQKRTPYQIRQDEQIITSCKINKPLNHQQFVKFSTDYCKDKSWGYGQSQKKTNCQYYARQVLKKYATGECVTLMEKQIVKNWKEALKQGTTYGSAKISGDKKKQ